jgi:RNA polymerase sigma-70 factor (ECF subfamily)
MEELYERYARNVFRFLMSRTEDADLSEELTQETFYQAIRSIHRFDGSCKILTWLCSIAQNQLRVYRRKHPVEESIEAQQRDRGEAGISAEGTVLERQGRTELLTRIHRCPEPYREVIYLRVLGEMSFAEIGEVMGRSENWARVTFYRGKEKLRKELEHDEK